MRKIIKKQCLEAIEILSEAHSQIKNFIDKNEPFSAINLLGQCQETAIVIGSTIEKYEGAESGQIKLLEDYCEFLWNLSESLTEGRLSNLSRSASRLDYLLSQLSSDIEKKIPDSKEIVFLPYKASMWDSLESVWREKSAEENVSAIVIPIPYFDKNSEGKFESYHYEGDSFPADVPVVPYQNYNLAENHPDEIYIHNPYDNSNYVTSIHPDYYSSVLKNYTDCLVYIPYFVLDEIDPSNKTAAFGAEHFIATPAVINAHKVIVQSEGWRQGYIEVMVKYAGEESRRYWERKISVRISPKLERVKNLQDRDFLLPEDWKRLIYKPDESRKKIIFYNTGVAALLENNEQMIDKISRVINFFKENSTDVTLLWRPHPLIEATLKSMRPELFESYINIVKNYKKAAWGIYDDSAELDRAIAVSDAYFGDMSSVVQLYRETGKPIMIQNCYV